MNEPSSETKRSVRRRIESGEMKAPRAFAALLDAAGRLVEVDRASLVESSLDAAEVLRKPLRDAWWWSWSADAQNRLDAAIELARGGVASRYDDELRFGGTTRAVVELRLLPVASGNGVTHIVVSATDLTRQQRREHLLAAELEITDALAIPGSPERASAELLERLCAHFGFGAAELWLFEREACVRFAVHDQRPNGGWATSGARLIDEGLPSFVRKTGQAITVDLANDPRVARADHAAREGLRFAMAVPIGTAPTSRGALVVFSSEEIHDDAQFVETMTSIARKVDDFMRWQQAEDRREKALAEARAASDAKSAFLANMSHEIRTPITAILGYADILLSRAVDGADVQALEAIERSGHHLVRIVNDILDLTRIEAGRLELEHDTFAPVELARDLRSMMALRAEAKGLALNVVASSPIPSVVTSDVARVRQVLVNLVGNAIKFTERGKVVIALSYDAGPSPPVLEFDVEDTGIGIAPDQIEQIFAPFTQVDVSATREHDGCGLGLAISRRLAQSLGGSLGVRSRLGLGSVFTLRIPCPPTEGATLETPDFGDTPRTPSNGVPRLRLDGLRVLAVDDLREIRHIVQYYLEEAGAEVRTAKDGAGAIEAIEHAAQDGRPFDVVVLDMQMPVMDGWTAARKLREIGNRIPVIALTASAMAGDRERALEAGCTDHVVKPIRPKELLETVRKHANGRAPAKSSPPTNMHLLLVDDDPDIREMMSLLLSARGYRVSPAGTCAAALELARTDRPDVVICDITLPDGDGYRLAEQLRALLGSDPPVTFIAVSGHDRNHGGPRTGFDRHLQKPVWLPALVEAIEESEAAKNAAHTER
jgi:signal transduction histidine kinase/DNA-binding response OmpR family regulator